MELKLYDLFTKKFQIEKAILHKVTEKLSSLNTRLNKKGGVGSARLEVVNEYNHYYYPSSEAEYLGPEHMVTVPIVEVKLLGDVPKIPGWSFVAKIEHLNAGNVIFNPSGEELDSKWQKAEPWCDHCKIKRMRKDTYLVKNDTTGELYQVGSSCVRDFTGHDPERIISWYNWFKAVGDSLGNFGLGSGCREDRYVYVKSYLHYAATAVRLWGWVSATKAREDENLTSTISYANMIESVLTGSRASLTDREKFVTTEQDREFVKEALNWLNTEIATKDTVNDYENNLLTTINNEFVPRKALGIVVSLIGVYSIVKAKREAVALAKKNSFSNAFIGTVGDRVEVEVEVLSTKEIRSEYYSRHSAPTTTYLVKFKAIEGSVLTWFGTAYWIPSLQDGDRLIIRGTVKKHDTYNGFNSTIITRVTKVKEL